MLGAIEIFVFVTTFLSGYTFLRWIICDKNQGGRIPPSLPSLPLVGSLPFIIGHVREFPKYLMKASEKLGPIFVFYSGRRVTLVLNGKELITEALVKNSVDFADKPSLWTEKNLFNVNFKGLVFKPYNESYKKHHKLSLSILKEFGFGVNSVSERRILEEVAPLLEEIRRKNGKKFNPNLTFSTAVSRMFLKILFGSRFILRETEDAEIREAVLSYLSHMRIEVAFAMTPLLRFLPIYRKKLAEMTESHTNFKRGIDEAIARSSADDEPEENFVKRFAEIEGKDYDRYDLFYIVRDFCFGSLETVQTTLRWAMVLLANNPDCQERLQKEIDSVIATDRLPSLDDKRHLPYTEAVILEIMRIKTLNPVMLHSLLRDITFRGYFFGKGTFVMINMYSIHMDPKIWSDPDIFRPERFLDDDNNVIGSDRIIPFGLGKRSCIGEILARQQIFLFFTSLFQHFHVRPPEGQDSIFVTDVEAGTINPSEYEVRLISRKS